MVKMKNTQLQGRKNKLRLSPAIILALMIIFYVSYFSFYQIERHNAHWTFLDFAGIEQTMWNTVQGRPFTYTLFPATGKIITDFESRTTISLLGDHVQPILLLLALPYALFPRSETLLISMGLGIGLGAIPFYRIAKRRVHSDGWALLMTWVIFSYLLYKPQIVGIHTARAMSSPVF